MDSAFENGWKYFVDNTSVLSSQLNIIDWVNDVNKAVNTLEDTINKLGAKNQNTNISTLKGFVAEEMHAGTFNIDSAINKSTNKAFVQHSNDYGSVDISTNFGKDYSLKYYKNAEKTVNAQATFDRTTGQPKYQNQYKLGPSDQYLDSKAIAQEKALKNANTRPEVAASYQDTANTIVDRISDDEGNSSMPFSRRETEKIASEAKKGKFDAKEHGLDSSEMIKNSAIIKDSLKAGVNAAMLSVVLKLGPEVYKSIDYLIKNKVIDKDQLKNDGFDAISVGAESFIKGFVSSMITGACLSGKLGESLMNVNPSIIGVASILAVDVIKDSYDVAIGKKTRGQLTENLIKNTSISLFALGGGAIGQAAMPVPVLGYLIGSFVGTVVGVFVYEGTHKLALSYCVDTGCTLFGIVDQNYELPQDVLEYIGVDVFEYEKTIVDNVVPDTMEFDTFEFDKITPDSLDIHILRRGVIGVNRIGYIS